MLRDIESMTDMLDIYIKKATEKIEYHNRNASASKLWNDLFRISKVFLTASGALTLTCLAVYDVNNFTIAITSSCFLFSGTILDELQKNYNFQFISFQHHQAGDDYKAIKFDMEYIKLERNEHTKSHELIEKYMLLESKNHIQGIRNCFLGCCLN